MVQQKGTSGKGLGDGALLTGGRVDSINASLGLHGGGQGWQFAASGSLMVQDVGDIISFKSQTLQDSVKVLQTLVIVVHMGRQVAIDDADIVAIKLQADVDSPFVPLVEKAGRRVGRDSGLYIHPSFPILGLKRGSLTSPRISAIDTELPS